MDCSTCAYRAYKKIPATPVRPAEIAFVGEAPGVQELSKKAPFAGQSGALIAKVLAPFGVKLQDSYLTNSMLCMPPKGKAIKKDCIRNCRDRVIWEMQQVQPKVIVAFGNCAMWSLTQDFDLKITKEQGTVIYSRELPGIPIVPCLHPAKVLRTPGDFANFRRAVSYALDIGKGKEIRDPGESKFDVLVERSEVEEAIEVVLSKQKAAADIETDGLRWLDDHILDLGVCYEKNHTFIFPRHTLSWLKPMFEGNVQFSWQNGFFDTGFLRVNGLPAEIHNDTMLQHYTLNENGPHDLDFLSSTFLGRPPYKSEVKKYGSKETGFKNVPKELLYPYLAKDCDNTFQLDELFLPQIEADAELSKLYHELLLPATRFLRRVARAGLTIDLEANAKLHEILMAEKDKLMRELQAVLVGDWDPEEYMQKSGAKTAPAQFLPTSPKQVSWLVYDKLALLPNKKKGTNKDILKEIEHLHPAIPLILKTRTVSKTDGTYVTGVRERIQRDGRVHTTYGVTKTVTGRLSSSDPNVQNIKSDNDIKSEFVAAPGKIFLEADYKAAELRVLAEISGDVFLTGVFTDGTRDLHDEVAIDLFGEGFTREQRMRAKAVNFGVPYDRSAYSLAVEHHMSEEEAQSLIDGWHRRSPEASAYLQKCAMDVAAGRVLTTPFGRRRRYGLITPQTLKDIRKEARNYRIQSIASDLTLLSAMELEKPLKQYEAKIVNLVHDSILIEMPDDPARVAAVAQLVADQMARTPKEKWDAKVPFVVDLKIGYAWGRMKTYSERSGFLADH